MLHHLKVVPSNSNDSFSPNQRGEKMHLPRSWWGHFNKIVPSAKYGRNYFIRMHADSKKRRWLVVILCILVFQLEDQSGGGTYIDLHTGPYYAAVISSHGYPAGNDTYLGRFNYILNMNSGVYITYTLITNKPLHEQQIEVKDGDRKSVV